MTMQEPYVLCPSNKPAPKKSGSDVILSHHRDQKQAPISEREENNVNTA